MHALACANMFGDKRPDVGRLAEARRPSAHPLSYLLRKLVLQKPRVPADMHRVHSELLDSVRCETAALDQRLVEASQALLVH